MNDWFISANRRFRLPLPRRHGDFVTRLTLSFDIVHSGAVTEPRTGQGFPMSTTSSRLSAFPVYMRPDTTGVTP
jgi:hypothetical protein